MPAGMTPGEGGDVDIVSKVVNHNSHQPAPLDRLDAARKRIRKDSPLRSLAFMKVTYVSLTSCPIDGGIVPACWDGKWGKC